MLFSPPSYPALNVYQWFRVIVGLFCFPLRPVGFSIFVGLIATASAHADQPNYNVKSIRDLGQRPKNFYRSIEDLDTACKRIILSLNEKYTIGEDKREPDTNRASDVLLGSKLELPWRRKVVHSPPVEWPLDYARIDWADKTPPMWIYRWAFYAENRLHNELIVSDKIPAELASDQTDIGDIISDLGGPNDIVQISPITMPELWRADNPPKDDTFIFNVVVVGGKPFIVAANAIQVESAGSRGGGIDVFAFRFASKAKISQACRFRSVK